MPTFTAKDVQALRQVTGAGMMDAKRALEENGGDSEAASKWLREKGLTKAAERSGRQNVEGAVALAVREGAVSVIELRCETDFVAKSDDFVAVAQRLADAVVEQGEGAVDSQKEAVDDLKVTLKENIEVGRVLRIEAADGQVLDTYLHRQEGRGKVGVAVVVEGGTSELAHDIAVHIAFTKPPYLSREEVPADVVEEERQLFERQARAEGKPEQALAKIVDGRLGGFFKERVLLDQPYVRDEKRTIAQLLGDAKLVRYALVVVGG